MHSALIEMDPYHPDAARMTADPAIMHKFTLSAATVREGVNRSGAGLLWRQESGPGVLRVRVTARAPLHTDIWSSHPVVTSVTDTGNPVPELAAGDEVRFLARVNADRSEPVLGGRGKKKPIVDPEQLGAWFRRRVDGVLSVIEDDPLRTMIVNTEGVTTSREKGAKWTSHVVLGTAVVQDSESACALVVDGLGRGKAFGFGMLTLVPSR